MLLICKQWIGGWRGSKMWKGRRDALHCSQKGGNRWLGASPSARKMKAHRSLFQDTAYLHKRWMLPPLCCFLRCGFFFSLNPSEPTLMSVCSCPFLCHHQQSLVRSKSDQLADSAANFIGFLPLLLPARPHNHQHKEGRAQSFLWMRGKDQTALFSSSYRLLGWFVTANLGK